MSATEKFGTIVLASVAMVFVTLFAAVVSGAVAGFMDSVGFVVSENAYLAVSLAIGILAGMHVLGVLD